MMEEACSWRRRLAGYTVFTVKERQLMLALSSLSLYSVKPPSLWDDVTYNEVGLPTSISLI